MQKVKTNSLIGAALDWAVAKCSGESYSATIMTNSIGMEFPATNYSSDWAQGGMIIEREKVKLDPRKGQWEATIWNEAEMQNPAYGPTILIAAMRCYVASRLGNEIEVPIELL